MLRRLIYSIVLIIVAVGLVSGCSGSQQTGAVPTLVEIPTLPPSLTASTTPSLAATETPTSTTTPSVTFTASRTTTRTRTAAPTATRTPRATLPPRASSTPSLTSTAAASPTTDILTTTGTSDALAITSFTASSSVAVVGASVTLQWQATGDTATLERLNQLGQVVQTFSITPTGQLPVTIPANEGSIITYRLTVGRGTAVTTQTVSVNITGSATNCTVAWFFGNEFAPSDAGCPTTAAQQVAGTYQPFQNGRMFFLQNTIYVLIDPGGTNTSGDMTDDPNGWDGTSTYASYNCGSPPPSGQFPPEQMFAWVYCLGLAPNGLWANTLGFATAPIDTTSRNFQVDASANIYVDTPAGNVYRLRPVPAGQLTSQWTKIK